MNSSKNLYVFKAFEWRCVLFFVLLIAISFLIVLDFFNPIAGHSLIFRRIMLVIVTLLIVAVMPILSTNLTLKIKKNNPQYVLRNRTYAIESMQIHKCILNAYAMKFVRINNKLFVIIPYYNNAFEHDKHKIYQFSAAIKCLKTLINAYSLNTKTLLDKIPVLFNVSLLLLLITALVGVFYFLW